MAKQRRKRAKRSRMRRKHAVRSRARMAHDAAAIEAALAGVAHDIRTPLTGIVALAELLASSDLPPRERRWAKAVKDGAEHLAALTTLIVDAARASTAGIALRREPFSPRRLVDTIATALTARAESKGIKVDIAISDLPDVLAGDVLRLRAALENLADNAVKFTQAGSVDFSVKAEPAGRNRVRLVFTFTDTGIGLSTEEIKRLFRPFAQASEQIARKYGGAGLGLSFVKRLAKLMGGDLTVTSTKGRGSTFRFNVQVAPVTAGPISLHESGAKKLETRPLAILCAEDNPYGRVVMNTILTEMGHRADFVESGEATVQAVQRNRYDVVLMDVTLTGLDGIEATRRIRALPGEAGKVPIIGISGRGEAANEQAARNAGMDFYFVKPVSPGKLAQALGTIQ